MRAPRTFSKILPYMPPIGREMQSKSHRWVHYRVLPRRDGKREFIWKLRPGFLLAKPICGKHFNKNDDLTNVINLQKKLSTSLRFALLEKEVVEALLQLSRFA